MSRDRSASFHDNAVAVEGRRHVCPVECLACCHSYNEPHLTFTCSRPDGHRMRRQPQHLQELLRRLRSGNTRGHAPIRELRQGRQE